MNNRGVMILSSAAIILFDWALFIQKIRNLESLI